MELGRGSQPLTFTGGNLPAFIDWASPTLEILMRCQEMCRSFHGVIFSNENAVCLASRWECAWSS